ncbi:MAG: hypothetical protein ACOCYN_02810, partial [Planctomycetota bacterium]
MTAGLLRCLAQLALLGCAAASEELVVSEYFAVPYANEPVSWEVDLPHPTPVAHIALTGRAPCQVEVLAGTPEACTRARIWTLVAFAGPGQRRFSLELRDAPVATESRWQVQPAERVGGIATAIIDTGAVRVRLPVAGADFARPVPAFDLPGPVMAIGLGADPLIGRSWIDHQQRVSAVQVATTAGPVFWQSIITYRFADGGSYRARVRLFPGRRYAELSEDCACGGQARFVFSYEDWYPEHMLDRSDGRLGTTRVDAQPNPCGDFITEAGQRCLQRLVVWSQFGYFAGKHETVGLVDRAGDLCIGGFYRRPDRWTRAKVNHVDLYERPMVPGRPRTRGQLALPGARKTLALEAWLVDGHREWALFASPVRDREAEARALARLERKQARRLERAAESERAALAAAQAEERDHRAATILALRTWIQKAHVRIGVWPLDRLNRLPLLWHADGSPVDPEHRVVAEPVGGTPAVVLNGTGFRHGLDTFNGSNSHMRGDMGCRALAEQIVEQGLEPDPSDPAMRSRMIRRAATAFMMRDDSAYPGERAMLPWSHPEALNPFYQGMENMNFNADRYRLVGMLGQVLHRLDHPQGRAFMRYAEAQMDLSLDRYVYPVSGCWEESHGYCSHTMKNMLPLAMLLRAEGLRDFFADIRFARMFSFWAYALSPRDPVFTGLRVRPPIGDHGLRIGPLGTYGWALYEFTHPLPEDPAIRDQVRYTAWALEQTGGSPPEGVAAAPPPVRSRHLLGYGSVLRHTGAGVSRYSLWRLPAALPRGRKRCDLRVAVPVAAGVGDPVHVVASDFRPARLTARIQARTPSALELQLEIPAHKRRAAAKAVVRLQTGAAQRAFTLDLGDVRTAGAATMSERADPHETHCVLRAGMSWGHHHQDKGSLWFWGRNVHFFGDCSWGSPPGGTYGNRYKQGPASGTQIEFVGVNNWPLPCKYATPFIADDEYTDTYAYAVARCRMPYNPPLDLRQDSPVALSNGYDRQTLLVGDTLVVRDNVESVCPTIWRLHSYHPQTTSIDGARATIAAPLGVTGDLAIVHPSSGVALTRVERDLLNDGYTDETGAPLPPDRRPRFNGSVELKWAMPRNTSATWAFTLRDAAARPATVESLEPEGRVLRIREADGRELLVMLD